MKARPLVGGDSVMCNNFFHQTLQKCIRRQMRICSGHNVLNFTFPDKLREMFMFKLIERLLVFEASKIFYRGSKKCLFLSFSDVVADPERGKISYGS